MTSAATKIAMDWWVARLSTPARPITLHGGQGYERLHDLHPAWMGRHDRQTLTAAYTHTPRVE